MDTISEKKVSDIKNRVKIGNESSADIFVSIHLNKIPQKQYSAKIKKQFEDELKKIRYLKQKYINVVSSANDIKTQYKNEMEQIIKQFKNK